MCPAPPSAPRTGQRGRNTRLSTSNTSPRERRYAHQGYLPGRRSTVCARTCLRVAVLKGGRRPVSPAARKRRLPLPLPARCHVRSPNVTWGPTPCHVAFSARQRQQPVCWPCPPNTSHAQRLQRCGCRMYWRPNNKWHCCKVTGASPAQ